MGTSVGSLDRRITIQRFTAEEGPSGTDEFGQPAGSWAEVAIVWANYRTTGGGESQDPSQRVARQRAVFRIRYRPGIEPRMRVVWDGETYDVKDVAEFDRRRWLDLTCEALEVASGPGT